MMAIHEEWGSSFMTQANPDYWQLSAITSSNASAHRPSWKDVYDTTQAHIEPIEGECAARWNPNPIALDTLQVFTFTLAPDTVKFYFNGIKQSTNWRWPSDCLVRHLVGPVEGVVNCGVGVGTPACGCPSGSDDCWPGKLYEFFFVDKRWSDDEAKVHGLNLFDPDSYFK